MGGKHRPATPRDRMLGAELRLIREQAGLSLSCVAGRIQWNISTLSRLERGQRHISPEAVMGLSVVYRLPAQQRHHLIARAKEPPAFGWWNRPPSGVPGELNALAAYENDARRFTGWSPGVIPDLLQTPVYAATVMRDCGVLDENLCLRLRARRRQEVLDRRRVDYTAFVGISALRNELCSPEDFTGQLQYLKRMSSHEKVVIRLVEAPTTFALCGWQLMEFENAGPVAVLEHVGSSTFLFDHEAGPYLRIRAMLNERALSVGETRDRIDKLITWHLAKLTSAVVSG